MKYIILFAVSAIATTILPRAEITTVKDDISTLRKQVQTFTTDLNSHEGNLKKIRANIKNIILAISSADGDLHALKGPLVDADAASLAIPIQDLGQDISKAVDALISQKSAIIAQCHGPEIYQSLVAQNMQYAAFERHLLARLSDNARALAKQVAIPIALNLARGVGAFTNQQNVKCPVSKSQSMGGSPDLELAVPSGAPSPASNGTSTFTGTAPTATIMSGSASNLGISFGLATLAVLGVLAL